MSSTCTISHSFEASLIERWYSLPSRHENRRSPNGVRSFPRRNLSKGVSEWNHYYVRGINGEVRLWVNGEEVSGGSGAQPRRGYLCLEAEGSAVEFRNLRIRELP